MKIRLSQSFILGKCWPGPYSDFREILQYCPLTILTIQQGSMEPNSAHRPTFSTTLKDISLDQKPAPITYSTMYLHFMSLFNFHYSGVDGGVAGIFLVRWCTVNLLRHNTVYLERFGL